MIGQFWYLLYNSKTREYDRKVSVEDAHLNGRVTAALEILATAREAGNKKPYAMLAFKQWGKNYWSKLHANHPGSTPRDGSRTKFVSAASATVCGMKQLAKGRTVLYFKFDPETLLYNEISFEDVTALAVAEKPEPKRRKKNG